MRAWCPSAGRAWPRLAIAEDLIDEYRLFVNPVILGGGTPYFTPLTEPLDLRLTESRTFTFGVVNLSLPAHALRLAPRNTCSSMWWKGTVLAAVQEISVTGDDGVPNS